jgi:hypothetical protein
VLEQVLPRCSRVDRRTPALELGPLTHVELGDAFDLSTSLSEGTLPGIIPDDSATERERVLASYAGTYLKMAHRGIKWVPMTADGA